MCFKDFLMLQTVTDLSSVSISLEIRNLEDCPGMGSRGRQPKPSAILEKHIVFATGQQKPRVFLVFLVFLVWGKDWWGPRYFVLVLLQYLKNTLFLKTNEQKPCVFLVFLVSLVFLVCEEDFQGRKHKEENEIEDPANLFHRPQKPEKPEKTKTHTGFLQNRIPPIST